MNDSIKAQIRAAFDALPDGCKEPAADAFGIAAFEREFGPIPEDYRWFLIECGGGTIGSEWIDGIDELDSSHAKFTRESQVENGWSMRGVFIIGWDGWGNPYGIDSATGKIVSEDHNFGGIHEVASSFESFLVKGLLS